MGNRLIDMQDGIDSTIDAATTAEVVPTSLDAYGQLLKMLLPRALNIAIYDRGGGLLWTVDGCESNSLQQLVDDQIAACLTMGSNDAHVHGMLHTLDGEHAYVFPLLDSSSQLQGVAVTTCGERPGQQARS